MICSLSSILGWLDPTADTVNRDETRGELTNEYGHAFALQHAEPRERRPTNGRTGPRRTRTPKPHIVSRSSPSRSRVARRQPLPVTVGSAGPAAPSRPARPAMSHYARQQRYHLPSCAPACTVEIAWLKLYRWAEASPGRVAIRRAARARVGLVPRTTTVLPLYS
ncbi:hypothetical protein DAI22_02g307500 [Oryza sativa Japonica Group]|nr:hypothetical protein DAI22_02g307500 [Oryza sativa Japonica Group]